MDRPIMTDNSVNVVRNAIELDILRDLKDHYLPGAEYNHESQEPPYQPETREDVIDAILKWTVATTVLYAGFMVLLVRGKLQLPDLLQNITTRSEDSQAPSFSPETLWTARTPVRLALRLLIALP